MKNFRNIVLGQWLPIIAALVALTLPALLWAADNPDRSPAASTAINPALATSVARAMSGLQKQSIHLVDVRPAADFEQFRIPGSIHMAVHAIRIKSFLKSKPIVLVNEGFSLDRLAAACETLNREGFQVTILAGGLLSWRAQGGPLVGDPFAMDHLSTVAPHLLAREAYGGHLLIIDAVGADTLPDEIPGIDTQSIPLMDNLQAPERLKALMETNRADPFFRLLIATPNGNENNRIQRQLATAGIHSVYLLSGGWQGYQQHLHDQRLAGRAKEERQVTTGPCSTCAP
ncbi:MAG: rhodanese-like domain-containing protein [Desulfatitalea sp.]|nr:rhodanese-like domain-containing protein [Desulfatitalea sp.]